MELPNLFKEQMRYLLGDEYRSFEVAMSQQPPVSLRQHPHKSHTLSPCADPVPWCPGGCYLPERPVFTLDPMLHAGAYYVQDASSMTLDWILRQIKLSSAPRAALDLCAAPGGKSLILHDYLGPEDLLICNEIHPGRYATLLENLTRHGSHRITSANWSSGQWARHSPGAFDLILADVPCSGEGMFRKKPESIRQWSPALIEDCVRMQRDILSDAVSLLREGGILIYATCTFNRKENEEQIQWLKANHPFISVPLDPPEDWGIQADAEGMRCYPHRGRFEGLFFSVLLKTEPAPPDRHSPSRASRSLVHPYRPDSGALADWLSNATDYSSYVWEDGLITALPMALVPHGGILNSPYLLKRSGLPVATLQKGGRLVPHHALALSTALSPDVATFELSTGDALRYLRKESLSHSGTASGYQVVRYQGLGLGWVKAIPGRLNNLLPTAYRIRM
jgi:16S rRNA C967 or C1407 C5-methylase (RsmB/RsmF family)/NOL1/NOP2/fmu family ribosome biogenesis protein